ncbi:MAG TPA: cupin domain-containing protein [Solirubrobacteraceae bacterium]|jgi:uncharacterized cupin superfamily protein|nr:cupin domain-containing protein [Solirubrobacteraceae bacterium]
MIEAVNIFDAVIEGRVDVAGAAGSTGARMYLYDIAPGESSCPYHYEYVDEWLLVVAGSVVVRTPDGERDLQAGALLRFPAGPAGAHKIMNRADSPARTLLFSVDHGPAVSVYPDSNKIGVWPGEFDENGLIFVRDSAVPWSHGEDGWNKAE